AFTITTTVPIVPTPQPIPRESGNDSAPREAASASPNCVIGIGPGRVTIGSVLPVLSVNCICTCVTTTPVVPFGLTITVIGTRNGDTAGQKKLLTGCAMTVFVGVLKTSCEVDVIPDWSAVGFVSVAGALSVHDAASATRRGTPRVMGRGARRTPRSMWSDMGSLPIESGRAMNCAQVIASATAAIARSRDGHCDFKNDRDDIAVRLQGRGCAGQWTYTSVMIESSMRCPR